MKSLVILFLLFVAVFSIVSHVNASAWQPRFDTGGLSRDIFPKGFVFGSAASAYQVEGMANKDGRGSSIWDVFVKVPGNIKNNATGEVSIDQYNHYKEDVNLMQMMNFDAYRFSISWPRIFPNGTGEVNWKGVAYYNRLIDYMLEKGITPHANLYHYDLPLALQERYGGFLSKQIVKDYADYAEFCFKTFGDRIKNWWTFNEPKVIASLGFDNGINPPNRCSKEFGNCTEGNSATEPYIAAHHLILSHAEASKRYREKYKAEQKGRVGVFTDFVWYEPLTKSKADNYAAQRARDFHIGWFLHPFVYGEYPRTMQKIVGERLPKFSKSELEIVKNSFDVLGLNHYTSYYIYDAHQPKTNVIGYQHDWNVGYAYERNGVPIGRQAHSPWIYEVPSGIYKVVTYVKERYGNPEIILSENGMDDPGNVPFPEALFDTNRVNYYTTYLKELKRAMDDGANVTGYFAWSMLDNFEWLLGYTSRFGLIYVDYNDLKRYPKMSAYWFRQMLQRKKA
ncbi:beta-glucosidase 44-like [Durio zibethinus]|uniref:Beta-glucosidase 44-like n=1 Tax=Durio zibethinus TaxID=66656 RepID=A0A6P5WIW4_DURZI|nr:beta-glucosidase 44-like [Durio zibethinus]